MTENEAIKIIGEVPVSLHYEGSLGKIKKAYDVVRKAVEKVQAFEAIGTIEEFKALKEKSVDIEKIVESIEQLPTKEFLGVLHIPRTATINRIKRGGNCELPGDREELSR